MKSEAGELGRLRRVVLDPPTHQVTHLVVDRTDVLRDRADVFPGEEGENPERERGPTFVVVPLALVERATASGLFLGLGQAAVEALPAHREADFAVPDAAWAPTFDYAREDVRLALTPATASSTAVNA